MNSYHLAINLTTNNEQCPEQSDLWRNFHPQSNLLNSDLLESAFEQIEFLQKQAI